MSLAACFCMADKPLSIPGNYDGKTMDGQVFRVKVSPICLCLGKLGKKCLLVSCKILESVVKTYDLFCSSFQPLENKPENSIELCMCCSCYPYEEDEEEVVQYINEINGHPYLAPNSDMPNSDMPYQQWQNSREPV